MNFKNLISLDTFFRYSTVGALLKMIVSLTIIENDSK